MIRLLRWLLKGALVFVAVTILWVAIYRIVPPPFTFTMLGDVIGGRGVAKSWMPLSRMDPAMARAAIAGEDSHFCSHHGFDYGAIAKAALRNERGAGSAAARRSASRPRRTSS